jgi:glycosyltransferase involved in cell wall biosynthesis
MTATPTAISVPAGTFPTAIRRIVLAGIEHSRLGGVASFMNTIAHGFLDRGYEVQIIGINATAPENFVDFRRDPRIGLHTICDTPPPPWPRLSRVDRYVPWKRWKLVRWQHAVDLAAGRLRPMIESWGPETLVICTQVYAMEYLTRSGLSCGRLDGPYVIAQYHSSRIGAVRERSIHRVKRWNRDADRFLLLTEEDARLFQSADGMNNTGWLPNPLRPLSVDDLLSGAMDPRRNEIISLNRYDAEKSLDWLIRAWAQVAPDFPEWRLRMFGEGELRAELTQLIDLLGVADSAILEGITTEAEHRLRTAKINAVTSQFEGLPLTIAEAARAGTPTVAFDCAPGIRYLIEDGTDGLVVPRNNLPRLVDALRRLMGDDTLRASMGASARDRSSRFDLDVILDRWEHEMRILAGGGPGCPRW